MVVRIHGTVLCNIGFCLLLQPSKLRELIPAFPCRLTVALKIRPVLNRNNRKVLIGEIDQQTVLIEKLIQGLLCKPLYTGLQGKLRIFPAHIDRIKLNTSRLAYKIKRTLFSVKNMPA